MTDEIPSAQARFAELVKLHLDGRKFLARRTERRLVEDGVTRYGLSIEDANGLVRQACEQGEVAMEAEVGRSTSLLLKTLAGRNGRIGKDDFRKAASFYRARTGNSISEAEAERRVKRKMEELNLAPARSGMIIPNRRWFSAIRDRD